MWHLLGKGSKGYSLEFTLLYPKKEAGQCHIRALFLILAALGSLRWDEEEAEPATPGRRCFRIPRSKENIPSSIDPM